MTFARARCRNGEPRPVRWLGAPRLAWRAAQRARRCASGRSSPRLTERARGERDAAAGTTSAGPSPRPADTTISELHAVAHPHGSRLESGGAYLGLTTSRRGRPRTTFDSRRASKFCSRVTSCYCTGSWRSAQTALRAATGSSRSGSRSSASYATVMCFDGQRPCDQHRATGGCSRSTRRGRALPTSTSAGVHEPAERLPARQPTPHSRARRRYRLAAQRPRRRHRAGRGRRRRRRGGQPRARHQQHRAAVEPLRRHQTRVR